MPYVRQAEKQAKQTRQYHMLIQLGQELTSSLDLSTVLGLITQYATELLSAHSAVLLLRDESTHETTYVSVYNVADELLEKKLSSSESLGNQIIDNKRPIVLDDYSRYPRRVALLEQYNIKAVAGVPIIWQDQAIGSLNIHTADPNKRFDEDDIDLLLGFANYAAIAIINAKLYSKTTEELQNIKMLNEICQVADSKHTLQELITWLTANIKSFYPKNDYMLIVRNPLLGSLAYSSSSTLDHDYIAKIARLADEYVIKQSYSGSAINLLCDSSNILTFPLFRKQRLIGYLLVLNNDLDKAHIQTMENIASHISVTIENSLLNIQTHSDLEHIINETNSLNHAIRKITELSLSDDLNKHTLDLALFLANAKTGCFLTYSPEGNCFAPRSCRNMSKTTLEKLVFILGENCTSLPKPNISPPKQINFSVLTRSFDSTDLINPYILPLIFREQVIGVLVIDEYAGNMPDSSFSIMQIFTDIAAIAIKNADLYQNQKKIVNEMRDFSQQLLESQKLLEGIFHIHNELLRQVLNSSTISEIAWIVYENTNMSVLVEDSAGNTLAECPDANGISTIYSKLKEANFLDWFRRLQKEKKPTFYVEKEDVTRYVVPLVASDKIVGFLSMVAQISDFTAWQKHIAESSALAFSMTIVNANRTLEIEESFKGEILEALIDEKYLQNKEDILHRASYMGLHKDMNYRLIIVDFHNDHSSQIAPPQEHHEPSVFDKRLILASLSRLSQHSPDKLFFVNNPQGIIIACPTTGDSKAKTVQICSLFMDDFYVHYQKNYSFIIGVSSELSGLLDFRKGFMEACKCLVIGQACKHLNKPTYFEDTGLLGFLFQDGNEQLLGGFVLNQIGPLITHDKKTNLCLVDTLECYLDNNCSLSDTAKCLYIHVNTLKYRLKKIKEITSIDQLQTEQRLNLYAACKMYRILFRQGTTTLFN